MKLKSSVLSQDEVSMDIVLLWSSFFILCRDVEVEGEVLSGDKWPGERAWLSRLPLVGESLMPNGLTISFELPEIFDIGNKDDPGETIVGGSMTPSPSRYLSKEIIYWKKGWQNIINQILID